jgi:uncharacterized protein (DUF362 family)
LMQQGARSVILVERSGMGNTRQIMRQLGAIQLIQNLGAVFLSLEELGAEDWRHKALPGSHWLQGVEVPGFLLEKPCVVQICNLNTHRFGGQFSASLKNSVGLIAKYGRKDSYNYMKELHQSPDQCQMIAEINQLYSPSMAIMDATQSFIVGGPDSGETAVPGVVLASRDRVALDAVGVAILQYFGADVSFGGKTIFDHLQIKRAVELELGAKSAEEICLVTDDKRSRALADILENLLRRSSEQ